MSCCGITITGNIRVDGIDATTFYTELGTWNVVEDIKKFKGVMKILKEYGICEAQFVYRVADDLGSPGDWQTVGQVQTGVTTYPTGEVDISAITTSKMYIQVGISHKSTAGNRGQMEIDYAISIY